MHNLSEPAVDLKPSVAAAVGLLCRRVLAGEAALPSAAQILALTGSSKGQAYEMLARLERACHKLCRRPGRRGQPPRCDAVAQTMGCVRDFIMDHPGAVSGRGARRNYSVAFRRFVFDLLVPGGSAHGLTAEQAAGAIGVPLGTLKGWLRRPAPEVRPSPPDGAAPCEPKAPETAGDPPSPPPPPSGSDTDAVADLAGHPDLATVLVEWTAWTGDFSAFCDHIRNDLRLPYGRTFVASLLEGAGLRVPTRRKRPRPTWSKDTFCRLFPGAQWLGDGTTLAIQVNDQWYTFNLEAVLDVASNAVTGIHVSDAENEKAVLAAFEHGEHTTGHRPVAMTLDQKPCNHTSGVEQGIAPTTLVAATPGRGQAKAPLEGHFGLFAQTAPPLCVSGKNGRQLAASILGLVMLVWAYARNGRPRRRLGGRSPAQHYLESVPSTDDIQYARSWANELSRRQQRFAETKRRRADPVRRQILTEALERNGIDDPEARLAVDLARYAVDAIVHGIAIFETKRQMGTIPEGADPGRYLAGIIHNRHQADEIEQTGLRLLELRLRHSDLCLASLEAERDALCNTTERNQRPAALVDLALDAKRLIDFRFFATQAASALADLPQKAAQALYPHLVKRSAAAFATDVKRRQHLLGQLAIAVADKAA